MRRLTPILLTLLLLSACAPQLERVATVSAPRQQPTWAFEASDIPVDPAYKFGKLPNGVRYVIRQNATPKGTAAVRMEVATGSLDERDDERGFAHFVEHMAFNGSTNVPEGEMIKLLQRQGLAFGADTNATTGFEQTTYMLDLPRNDAGMLDLALMLMREAASELTFDPAAVNRERGVVLSEMRDRNGWQMRNYEDQAAFLHPGARYTQRLPIGTEVTLAAASAETLKAYWQRNYVPANTTLVVVGDFDASQVEAAIKARFESWQQAPQANRPSAGPIDIARNAAADIHIDPASSERVSASRHGKWLDEPDTIKQRQENTLRQIGYAIINRRMQRHARLGEPPFRDAGIGTGDVFKAARTTNLIVDTVDGKWRRGLIEAATEYRRALRFGFTDAEIAEQIATLRERITNDVASASTRHHRVLLGAVFALLRNDNVPATPENTLARFGTFAAQISAKQVLASLRREAVRLNKPLLRFQGRRSPEGGERALQNAWNTAMRARLKKDQATAQLSFAYTDFGPAGAVTSDAREPLLGIRSIRYANGLRLNLKRTDLEKDRIALRLNIDGGDMLKTNANPLASEMVSVLAVGGLGKHSEDELQSLLAGHTVSFNLTSASETFASTAQTTPRDLTLQLQLLTALISDPGYRPEGELRYRLTINNFFQQLNATPGSALSNALGGIHSDFDPRFTLQKVEDYRKLTFAKLKADIADRLTSGAIELAIVGDVDEEQAIALVGKTLGALPPREAEFRPYAEQRLRPFAADRKPRVVRHSGLKDQALLRLSWPTRDDSDPVETITLELLERIVQVELTETLREKLGKAYSPSASSSTSEVWRGYGVFGLAASLDVAEVNAARTAIHETIARLRDAPVSPDALQRARQPLIENYDNALKSNFSWLQLSSRAQTKVDKIERFIKTKDRLLALGPNDVQAAAARYLLAKDALEVLVLPEGVDPAQP